MEREFILNFDKLNSYIDEWQKDEDRTDWELTMLRDNCRDCFKNELDNLNQYILIVNESTRDITINGQTDLQDKFNTIPSWYEIDNKTKIYRQVKMAMDEAKTRWIYDETFKEIKEN